jgi:hypothetical protein
LQEESIVGLTLRLFTLICLPLCRGGRQGDWQCKNRRSRLTAEEAQAKGDECREMARRAIVPEHRIMLEHMAETWEQIAKTLMTNGS